MQAKKFFKIMSLLTISFIVILSLPAKAFAELVMFDYSTDPAIITAGDQVDIIVSFKDEPLSKIDYQSFSSYKFKLVPKDTLAKKYITVIDSDGDDLAFLDAGKVWNVKFKIKVASNTPPGNYTLELYIYKYDENGHLQVVYSKDITINVKKEGSDVVLGTITTDPYEIRVGDDFVNLFIQLSNIGYKVAKAISLDLGEIKGVFEHKYATDYKKYVPVLNPLQSQQITYQYEVKEYAKPGVYRIPYNLTYKDEDNKLYKKAGFITIKIKPKPILVVAKSEGTAKIGGNGKLYIYVKNTGQEKAEDVRVRLLLDSSLPLKTELRSQFIGDLKPGEEKLAVFPMSVDRFANENNYSIAVQLVGKGDSDENDNRVYVYYRNAQFEVKGKEPNKILYFAYASGALVVLYGVYLVAREFLNKKTKEEVKKGENRN
ncbi:MAG: COG1361 S-layer family protein [Nanoarchaeota archaeon]